MIFSLLTIELVLYVWKWNNRYVLGLSYSLSSTSVAGEMLFLVDYVCYYVVIIATLRGKVRNDYLPTTTDHNGPRRTTTDRNGPQSVTVKVKG